MKLSSKSQWADASLRDLKLGGCRIHVAPPSPPSMSRRVIFSQIRVKRISSPFVSNFLNTLYMKKSTNLFPPTSTSQARNLSPFPHAEMNFYPTLQFILNILAFLHTNPQCRKAMQPRYAITQKFAVQPPSKSTKKNDYSRIQHVSPVTRASA
jgi:hypothetical protein